MDEVKAVLKSAEKSKSARRCTSALSPGRRTTGLGEHDYPAWQVAWRHLFETDKSAHVSTANPWPSADDLKSADVLVFYQRGEWTPERARDIDAFLRRGGGLVYIHYAVDGGTDPTGFAERIGLAWQGGRSKFRHGPVDLEFVPGSKHPIVRNLSRVHLEDESYWDLVGKREGIKLLATAPKKVSRSRCSGPSSQKLAAAFLFPSPGIIPGRLMIRSSAFYSSAESPGRPVNRLIGSTNWYYPEHE